MDWTSTGQVKAYLGLPAGDIGDDATIGGSVDAVNSWLDGYAPTVGGLTFTEDAGEGPVELPTPAAAYGATTLAARLYSTRNSPTGIAGFTELGGATYVSRYLDVQTQQLLRLGQSTPGRVG